MIWKYPFLLVAVWLSVGDNTVVSGCFTVASMFEERYRNSTTPLKAYTSLMPIISERIELTSNCQNSTNQTFEWTVEQRQGPIWRKLYVASPNAKVYDLAMCELGPGFYKLSCSLAVVSWGVRTMRQDTMYLHLIDPPLVAGIEGGEKLTVNSDADIFLDAVSNSYDPVIGYGKEYHLAFYWQCFKVVEGNLKKYLTPLSDDTSYLSGARCTVSFTSTGVVTVSASSLQLNAWFLFEVVVSKNVRSARAIQAIHIVDDARPELFLYCKWNCEMKRSRRVRMIYDTRLNCTNCTDDELTAATYQWDLYKYYGANYGLVLSGPDEKVFQLAADFLDPGKSYKLKVTVSNVGTLPSAWATSVFIVSGEPYDGTCTVNPLTGNAATDDFRFECKNWKDDGPRYDRNKTLDADEPLTYVISQIKGNVAQIIYTGNEATTVQKLEVCPKESNYLCKIEFRIRDLFNAEAIVNIDVTVHNPAPDLPPVPLEDTYDPEEGNPVLRRFLEEAELAVRLLKMSRDSEKMAKVASAYMSAINDMPLPEVTSASIADAAVAGDGDVNNVVANALTFLTSHSPDMIRTQEATAVLTSATLEAIELLVLAPYTVGHGNIDSNGIVLPTTKPSVEILIMLTSALSTTIEKPEIVMPGIESNVSNGLSTLSKVFMETLKHTRDISQIESAMKAIGDAESRLNNIQANDDIVEDLDDLDGAKIFVNKHLTKGERMFNDFERKYLKKVIKTKRQIERQKRQQHIGKTFGNSEIITGSIFALMGRIKKKTLDQEEFGLSVEEETAQSIVNSSRAPLNGINFKLDGLKNETTGNKNPVILKLRVVKRNIYTDGDNAKLVNSPVVVARVQKEDGSLAEISKPVVKQADPVTSPYKLITPLFIKEDAAKLFYHRLFYRSLLLNICLSVLPINDIKLVYDMFLRTGTPPTDITFDHYTSYKEKEGESGINYCIPAGILKRTGVVYLGLRPRLNEADDASGLKSTTTSNESSVLETPYMFRVTTIGCFAWDAQLQDWNSSMCEV
ncbi:sperm receptor for egg jelly-like [Gigantopelta aegis]|uniref:sperm receptor for egg jelly-like n=1 Tax=Gigantopelta aegis TaxID=1735272 RepID=UPI001B88D2FE|nr:sperm receptor for egg jelly-like [Gigantopelta aegis]